MGDRYRCVHLDTMKYLLKKEAYGKDDFFYFLIAIEELIVGWKKTL